MCRPSAYAVWVPEAIWPSAATNASANAAPILARSARYPAASSGRPMASAISAISAASWPSTRWRAARRGLVVAGREPVVVAVAEVAGAQVVGIAPLQEVHPGGHRAEVPLAGSPVSPYILYSVHGTMTPASPQAGAPAQVRLSRGAMSVKAPRRQLGVGHVIEPLGEERGDVAVVAGGAGEDLGVAEPAEPLVALRAVGRHADEVAALAPVDVAEQLVEPGLRGLEGAGGAGCRSARRGPRCRPGRVARVAGDLGVAEAVEREPRLEHLPGRPAVTNSSVCRAVRRFSVYRLPSAASTSPCRIADAASRPGRRR